MKQTVFLGFLLFTSLFMSSCSKDDDDDNSGSHKVVYRVTSSSNVNLSSIVYTNAQGDQTANTAVTSNTWTSPELNVPSSVQVVGIGANGATTNGTNGELKVEIIVDGDVKKTNTAEGPILSATSTYSF